MVERSPSIEDLPSGPDDSRESHELSSISQQDNDGFHDHATGNHALDLLVLSSIPGQRRAPDEWPLDSSSHT